MSTSDKVIRVPAEAHAAAEALAEQDHRSIPQEIAWLVLAEIERRKRARR